LPVNQEEILNKFGMLLEQNISLISNMLTEAIEGVGNFENSSPIDIQKLKNDDFNEKETLNNRLDAANTNKIIFEGHQQNIYFTFSRFEEETIILNCILGTPETPETQVEKPFSGIGQGGI
jgi:hypothetical protein